MMKGQNVQCSNPRITKTFSDWIPGSLLLPPPTSEGKSDLSWCNLPARTRCQLGLQPQEELTPPTEGKRSISLFDSLNLSAGAGAWCENVDMRDLTVWHQVVSRYQNIEYLQSTVSVNVPCHVYPKMFAYYILSLYPYNILLKIWR